MKTSSNYLSRMQVPTVMVQMEVQQNPTKAGVMPGVQDVQFELSKETLATMLDGLGKIRDQLASMK
jgi:COMM domain containing 9